MKPQYLSLVFSIFLIGCTTTSQPVVMKMTDGRTLQGTTSQVAGEYRMNLTDSRARCAAAFNNVRIGSEVTAPITCSDGRSGNAVIALSSDNRTAIGNVAFANGIRGNFATGVLSSKVSAPQTKIIRTSPIASSRRVAVRSSISDRTCYVGPRGGTYTITSGGNKNYNGCTSAEVVKPPRQKRVRRAASRTSGRTCYTGPRGGTYTITSSGRKNYGGC